MGRIPRLGVSAIATLIDITFGMIALQIVALRAEARLFHAVTAEIDER